MTAKGQRMGRVAGSLLAVGRRALFAAPFVVVVLAPAFASWHGLVALGHDWLNLGGWAPLVPLTIDSAALYLALLAWRGTLAGDSAGMDRFLVWVYAGASAALNMWHADSIGGMRSAVFYGIASLSAAMIWERTLRALRRQELRDMGAIDAPAPRYRALRWIFHTRETYGAWKVAIGHGISSPQQALDLYRQVDAALPPLPREEVATDEEALAELLKAAGGQVAPELAGLTKRQAMALALREVGLDEQVAARVWLAERGIKVDRSGIYKRARELKAQEAAPRLAVVGSN
jgi:hypothetical protein